MSINDQIGKLGQDDTSGIEPQGGEVSVTQRLDDLEKRAKDVSESFQKIEKSIEKHQNFTYIVVGAIAIVFVITSILIGLDYFKNNEDRYEKFIEKTEEIKQQFYTKDQIDSDIKTSTSIIKDQLDSLKNCLNSGKYYQCF